jgi:hypothetical protein
MSNIQCFASDLLKLGIFVPMSLRTNDSPQCNTSPENAEQGLKDWAFPSLKPIAVSPI